MTSGAPDEVSSEEELDEIVAKGEFGETMGVGCLAVGAENEENKGGLNEIVVVGLVSVMENELESAVAVVVIE